MLLSPGFGVRSLSYSLVLFFSFVRLQSCHVVANWSVVDFVASFSFRMICFRVFGFCVVRLGLP